MIAKPRRMLRARQFTGPDSATARKIAISTHDSGVRIR